MRNKNNSDRMRRIIYCFGWFSAQMATLSSFFMRFSSYSNGRALLEGIRNDQDTAYVVIFVAGAVMLGVIAGIIHTERNEECSGIIDGRDIRESAVNGAVIGAVVCGVSSILLGILSLISEGNMSAMWAVIFISLPASVVGAFFGVVINVTIRFVFAILDLLGFI